MSVFSRFRRIGVDGRAAGRGTLDCEWKSGGGGEAGDVGGRCLEEEKIVDGMGATRSGLASRRLDDLERAGREKVFQRGRLVEKV
jgi:hypothetical protein